MRAGVTKTPQTPNFRRDSVQESMRADVIWRMRSVESGAPNLYAVLGVPRDADAVTIKRAFRARARECHPDVAGAPGAAERFRALAAAYDVLSTPDTRLVYDYGVGGDAALRALRDDPRFARYGAVAGLLVALAFLALLLFG